MDEQHDKFPTTSEMYEATAKKVADAAAQKGILPIEIIISMGNLLINTSSAGLRLSIETRSEEIQEKYKTHPVEAVQDMAKFIQTIETKQKSMSAYLKTPLRII